MLERFGLLVWRDIAVDEPQLALIHMGIAFGDLGLTGTQGFYLGPFKHDAAFEVFLDGIVEAGAAVFRHDLVVLFRRTFGFIGHKAP